MVSLSLRYTRISFVKMSVIGVTGDWLYPKQMCIAGSSVISMIVVSNLEPPLHYAVQRKSKVSNSTEDPGVS